MLISNICETIQIAVQIPNVDIVHLSSATALGISRELVARNELNGNPCMGSSSLRCLSRVSCSDPEGEGQRRRLLTYAKGDSDVLFSLRERKGNYICYMGHFSI